MRLADSGLSATTADGQDLDPATSTWSWSSSACGPTPSWLHRPVRRSVSVGAIVVDRHMRTNLPHVFAAGDCVVTHHRLLGETYLPLGTTAHKQGRVAGENALGGDREFAGSLGTQVVKVFDHAVARTGLRDHEADGRWLRSRHGRLRGR